MCPSLVNGDSHEGVEDGAKREPSGPEPDSRAGRRSSPAPATFGGEDANLEDFVAAGRSLADHLNEQLQMLVTEPAERLIGAHLIHMVDEAGYLQGDLDDLADKLGAPKSLVEKVLEKLQGFDPTGVFARNLAECLALQLKDRNRYDPQMPGCSTIWPCSAATTSRR